MDENVGYFELFKDSPDRVSVPAGMLLFEEGQSGDKMFVVMSGVVDLRVAGKTIETVEKGGILGELALVDNEVRSATAVVVEDASLVPIERKRFLYLVQQMPYFAIHVMGVMAQRLRKRLRETTQ
jgi:CRP/FNR family transcriptional regulator, cyclic AMP receptor protein